MPESDAHSPSVATAEPPQPPAAPPKTGTGMPDPDRPGRKLSWGCLIALSVFLVLVLVPGLGALTWWRLNTTKPTHVVAPKQLGAFASVMAKAGVKAPAEPKAAVELTSVKPVGSHHFEANVTFGELNALLGAFSHAVTVRGAPVTLSNATLSAADKGGVALDGNVSAAGASYSGTVTGSVAFVGGRIVTPNGLAVSAAGIPIGGAQGKQVARVILDYANGYLAAAPGLKVESATVTATGVHVTGAAPDSISW